MTGKISNDIVKAAASTELLKASASIPIPLTKIVRPSKPKRLKVHQLSLKY